MLKAGKTNTTRLFCLIFEIFRGVIRKSGARFVATPALGDGRRVGSIIYIHRIEAGRPFSATPPYALFLAWGCAHSRTDEAGQARGALMACGLGLQMHTRAARRRAGIMQRYTLRKVCILCGVCTDICILLWLPVDSPCFQNLLRIMNATK